tara:strand:- start:4221 stop:5159 length:939 start_codon:yes stop_codon:yes gene_type:complete
MEDFNIFSIGVEDINTHEQEANTNTNMMYKPSADDGKDGTYKALIRFVPNIENPRNSLVKKYVNWLTGPDGESRLIDSPTTVGEHCPVSDAFFRLRKSESAVDRKASDKLKRRESYVSLVKIIKDPQQPELEGTYKIFKFGYKIKEKVDAELKPTFGDPTQVFDLFEGKNFELVITRQNDYNNYDKSKFSSSKSAIMIGEKAAERSKEDMATIKNELEGAPSLKQFEYRPWDDETRDFVNSVIKMYLNPGDAMDAVTNAFEAKPKDTTAAKAATTTTATPKAEKATTSKEDKKEATPAGGDDLESFLNDLEL